MSFILWLLFILTAASLATWLVRFVLLWFIDRVLPPLSPAMDAGGGGADLPSITVVVAAKDEAANIEACLTSLDAQDYPRLQIVAVDDRSTDGTSALMDSLAATRPRLRVLHVETLREGWFGKNNAMREGVAVAGADWLCFTDADCIQTCPRSLAIAMKYALAHDADFLSVLPSHEAGTLLERVVQPACSAVMMLWFSPMVVNNPRSKTAYANGAFMLMRRDCYEAVGGHESVRDQINEDMHLARRAKAAGRRLRVVTNRDLYTVRMYGTLNEIWRGWTRIYTGSFASVGRIRAAAFVMCFSTFIPWLALGVAAAAGFAFGADAGGMIDRLGWTALAACFTQIAAMALFYGLSRINVLYGITYPLGAAVALAILLNAIRCASGRGTIRWRGTTYRDGAIDGNADAVSLRANP